MGEGFKLLKEEEFSGFLYKNMPSLKVKTYELPVGEFLFLSFSFDDVKIMSDELLLGIDSDIISYAHRGG